MNKRLKTPTSKVKADKKVSTKEKKEKRGKKVKKEKSIKTKSSKKNPNDAHSILIERIKSNLKEVTRDIHKLSSAGFNTSMFVFHKGDNEAIFENQKISSEGFHISFKFTKTIEYS